MPAYKFEALDAGGKSTTGLLDAENAIGTELTEAFQIVPEQSTAAIIIHHPQAAYFNAGAVRELAVA